MNRKKKESGVPAGKTETLIKIFFEYEEAEWREAGVESMWAKPLGRNRYLLENIPCYVYDLSWKDTVIAKLNQGVLLFQQVHERGGHSTYRFILSDGITPRNRKFKELWENLAALGCIYERASTHLFAVDVPPEADINEAYRILEKGESDGIWGFEEAHCGHTLSD